MKNLTDDQVETVVTNFREWLKTAQKELRSVAIEQSRGVVEDVESPTGFMRFVAGQEVTVTILFGAPGSARNETAPYQ